MKAIKLCELTLNCLFSRRSKKTSTFRVTGLCEGNSPVANKFPNKFSRSVIFTSDVIHRQGRGIIVQVKKAVSLGAARPSGCTNSYRQRRGNRHCLINSDIDYVWWSQLHFLLVELPLTIIGHRSYCTNEIKINVFNQVNSWASWEFQWNFR